MRKTQFSNSVQIPVSEIFLHTEYRDIEDEKPAFENHLEYHIDEIISMTPPPATSSRVSRIQQCARVCGFKGTPTQSDFYVYRCTMLAQIHGGIFDPPADAMVFERK